MTQVSCEAGVMTPEDYLLQYFGVSEWAKDVVRDTGGLGLCVEMTLEMAAQFPELKRVFGSVRLLGGVNPKSPPGVDFDPDDLVCVADPTAMRRERPHWWLLTPSGEVVDPTRWQFPGEICYQFSTDPPLSSDPQYNTVQSASIGLDLEWFASALGAGRGRTVEGVAAGIDTSTSRREPTLTGGEE